MHFEFPDDLTADDHAELVEMASALAARMTSREPRCSW